MKNILKNFHFGAKRVKAFLLCLVLWSLVGLLSKLLFVLVYHSQMGGVGFVDVLQILYYGSRLDMAIAGYITLLQALLLIVSLCMVKERAQRIWTIVWRSVIVLLALTYAMAIVSNIGLYGAWGFPLDSTALTYLSTSLSTALSSISLWQWIMGFVGEMALVAGIYFLFEKTIRPKRLIAEQTGWKKALPESVSLLLLGGCLILPIRGGLGVSTNNTGCVFYSTNNYYNHAAVNPVFSFLESVRSMNDYADKFKFMKDDEAQRIVGTMLYTEMRDSSVVDSAFVEPVRLTQQKGVNVVFVSLESFSKYIMSETGHVKGVVPNLERLASEGLYFDNFYANSFRTDRGLMAMLSGFPAQPDMSLMKLSEKTRGLYSLASTLSLQGYQTEYYYGGDINFTNQRSYLMQTGYQKIISDTDFPSAVHAGKWGVHDEYVYQRALEDIKGWKEGDKPFFKTIQTSSSHEPFEVPYKSGQKEVPLNAFAYADHCLGEFIDALKQTPSWKHTLVVLCPDHLGSYPVNLETDKLYRYQIPLVMVGGVVEQPQKISTLGMQVDIAATLFGLLGIDHKDFPYSKDLLDPRAPHYAFFDCPGMMGMVTKDGCVFYDLSANRLISSTGQNTDAIQLQAKAYLQYIYMDINQMGK